ncbi:MAG: hypothetical protein GX678_08050 [Actinomycetales bacterium]|nr:hypothetical protein [Actinomycetales bacterium]
MSQPTIDEALNRLLELDDLEVREHREVYESIHTELRRQLQSPDSPSS